MICKKNYDRFKILNKYTTELWPVKWIINIDYS